VRLASILLALMISLNLDAAEPTSSTPPELATRFLEHLAKGEVEQATGLWKKEALNERQRERLKKLSEKIIRLGGIKSIKLPDVEKRERNLASHEVVVIVKFGSKDLAFGSISFESDERGFKISNLRSEKGWGGTTALLPDEAPQTTPAKGGAAE
jgi:hypothetical protein